MFQHLGCSAPQNWKITIATILASRRIFTTEASEQMQQIESPWAHPLFSGPPLCCLSISQNIDKYPLKYTKRLAKKKSRCCVLYPNSQAAMSGAASTCAVTDSSMRTPSAFLRRIFFHRIYGRFMENVETKGKKFGENHGKMRK